MFDIGVILAKFIGAVITITLHEWVKAFVSDKQGDPLPRSKGRLSINPLKHIEPIGFIIMVYAGFGWGKPVDTASIYYENRRKGTILTYTIPSAVNFLFGLLLIPALVFVENQYVVDLLFWVVLMNLRHAFFNIIPVHPLDGAKVFSVIRNPNKAIAMANNETLYQLLLIFFIIWGWVGNLIDPLCFGIMNIVRGILA